LSLDQFDRVLDVLLDDSDAGVRKFAIRSVSERNGPKVKEKLRSIADGRRGSGPTSIGSGSSRKLEVIYITDRTPFGSSKSSGKFQTKVAHIVNYYSS